MHDLYHPDPQQVVAAVLNYPVDGRGDRVEDLRGCAASKIDRPVKVHLALND